MALPGWDSLNTVKAVHDWLEGAALALFAALVVFDVIAHFETKRERVFKVLALISFGLAILAEILAYPYGQRNDELSGAEIESSRHMAAQAYLDAAEANKEAGVARNEAGKAIERASKAEERASKNEKEAARLGKLAADENLARVKLEMDLAPRTLTDSDRIEIAEDIRKFTPTFAGRKVRVSSYSADAEGIVFSLEIADILIRAGIEIDPVIGRNLPVGLVDIGMVIAGPIRDEVFIRSLMDGIHSRVDTAMRGEWDSKYTAVEIRVGVKPVRGLPDVASKRPDAAKQ